MDIEMIREFTATLPDVSEEFPFGPETLVLKTNAKIFLLIALENAELSFNVKCDPVRAEELREEFPENVLPGYHMNKKHWNTVLVRGLRKHFILAQVQHSYDLVKKKKK